MEGVGGTRDLCYNAQTLASRRYPDMLTVPLHNSGQGAFAWSISSS